MAPGEAEAGDDDRGRAWGTLGLSRRGRLRLLHIREFWELKKYTRHTHL